MSSDRNHLRQGQARPSQVEPRPAHGTNDPGPAATGPGGTLPAGGETASPRPVPAGDAAGVAGHKGERASRIGLRTDAPAPGTDAAAPSGADGPEMPGSAAGMVSGSAEQLVILHDIVTGLEAGVSDVLSEGRALEPEYIVILQRMDFVRQALLDMGAMLGEIAPHLGWSGTGRPDMARIRSAVRMAASLDGFARAEGNDGEEAQLF